MICNGIDPGTGDELEIRFSDFIESVDPLLNRSSPRSSDDIYVTPGWIDLQVNGFAGVDYNTPSATQEEIARSIRAILQTGVTRFYPTVITGSPQDMLGAFSNLAKAKEAMWEGAAMEAFHLEGPYISPDDGPRGAHPVRWVRSPDLEEFQRFQEAARGDIRLVTLSPEWPAAPRFIETLVREGIVVSIGHTRATSNEIAAAVSAGATLSTHLGNGAHAVLARHPNYIWDQLADDRLAASFIVDGIHLAPSFLKVALRAKGLERSLLVTDAVMPAGCAPGHYKLGEVDVELHSDGSVRLLGGTRLAGSALRMDRALQNVMQIAGLNLREAITLATRNPARLGRIASRQRGLNPGERADLVRFRVHQATGAIEVLETFLAGHRIGASGLGTRD
ncbi:MAG TPA: amidohydrolase family protein [Bryobacteraceae bacterium]|jgi:N-acetylglucosamine-6-phosphate deacetylase|nr:amidohydrolase family protein [Bryobacteraceae bacterium]